MEQESTFKNIAVIGIGASGGFCSILLNKNPYSKVTLFDEKPPFSTLLPTGGGRCNITYNEDDIKAFAKNYPRGEKFLLSVFSKFDAVKTRRLFEDLGIKTYIQEDNRVFPVSNSSSDVIKKLSSHLNGTKIIKEKVLSIRKENEHFIISTSNKEYSFDKVILATGGKGNGFELAKSLGHKIIETKPSLTAFDIKEKNLYKLSGISFKNAKISAQYGKNKYLEYGDILFTHKSISGPGIFKISALSAYDEISKENPLIINICLSEFNKEEIENTIKSNTKKSIKNVFNKFAPERFIEEIININKIDGNKQIAQIKKEEKEILINSLSNLRLHAISRIKDSEIVTAGGIDLNEVNAKTMESKLVKGLYFIGEILNIDGFTGGFNLQNCWSSAYIASLN